MVQAKLTRRVSLLLGEIEDAVDALGEPPGLCRLNGVEGVHYMPPDKLPSYGRRHGSAPVRIPPILSSATWVISPTARCVRFDSFLT
jgi:hypothetical protein